MKFFHRKPDCSDVFATSEKQKLLKILISVLEYSTRIAYSYEVNNRRSTQIDLHEIVG